MVKVEIKNIKLFVDFLSVATKFVQQGELTIYKDKTSLYCKNTQDFMASKLVLDTNTMVLDFKYKNDFLKFCTKDLISLKSALTIVMQVENINSCILELEELPPQSFQDKKIDKDGKEYTELRIEYYAKSLKYTGVAKFKLIAVDNKVIENFVTAKIKNELIPSCEFDINPINLDLLQNRTSAIVNVETDVSVFLLIDPETNKIIIDLNTRQTDYANSISLPIAETYTGKLNKELVFHESSFRIFNILKVKEKLHGAYIPSFNIFVINSEINQDEYYIKSTLLNSCLKGGK